MKPFIAIILAFVSTCIFGQEKKSIEFYKKKKIETEAKISALSDTLKILEIKIKKLTNENFINDNKTLRVVTTIKKGAKIKTEASPMSSVILEINDDTQVVVLDFIDDYYKVCIDNSCGFVSSLWIKTNPDIEKLIATKKAIEENNRILSEKAEERRSQEEKNRLIKKFGKSTYEKLIAGYFWIGMTDEMALISLGQPENINRTVTRGGTHEQWVYKTYYFYFDNGILTSYQN